MRPVDIIIKKRDGFELTREEIEYFVHGFTSGEIQDYQVSAWAMAVVLNGMTDKETTDLTMAMAMSGEILDLTGVVPLAIDKHSTGGVGDKTSLVVEPIVAACGVAVGKISGRGLGFSGGTLDKLESIPGYRTDLSREEFITQLRNVGLVLSGQSSDLAPADGKLYALRDVTGTIQSIPLIASSIMCKKIAGGAQAIVLDVKTGNGAFMKTLSEARELSRMMVAIGKLSGRRVVAVISDMNQPLGHAIGNSLELKEAIETLQGRGPADFREHCLTIASHMLRLGLKVQDLAAGLIMAESALANGSAWEKFRLLVETQGGDVEFIEKPERLPKAPMIETVNADQTGYLSEINARVIGETSVRLGAGRGRKNDSIDHSVGIVIRYKVGDFVQQGDPLFTIHANDTAKLENAKTLIKSAHKWSAKPVPKLPLFYDILN